MSRPMLNRLFWYTATLLLMVPYGISCSLGAVLAVDILFRRDRAILQTTVPRVRLHWAVVAGLCVLPLAVFWTSSLLPPWVNHWGVSANGPRLEWFPGPLHLILYAVPLGVVGVRAVFAPARRPRGYLPRLLALCVLVALPCAFPIWLNRVQDAGTVVFDTPWENVQQGLKSFYYNGLWEELYYRYLLINLFENHMGRGMAIGASALLFTVNHVSLSAAVFGSGGLVALSSLGAILLIGLASGYCFSVTRSVLPCIVFHGWASGAPYLFEALFKWSH